MLARFLRHAKPAQVSYVTKLNKLVAQNTRITRIALAASLTIVLSARVMASSVTYNFDQTLSGVAPSGPTPWLVATFSDSSANHVQLTLSAPGLRGNEAVDQWYFNLNPNLNAANLNFSEIAASGTFIAPVVGTGSDAFKPDHDGKYDIRVSFSGLAGNDSAFSGADSVTFDVTGIAGLRASDFLFGNTPAAGHGEILTAAYIETVGQAIVIDSPPAPVPDVAESALLLAVALVGIASVRRNWSLRPSSSRY